MQDELEFRRAAETALSSLKKHLIEREEDAEAGFEVEEQNGVLNVLFEEMRGQCALRPGVRGISSNIRVRSIIGRFLEHSRIFLFGNGGKPELYLGSADWMHRNIYERVEVMFHLRDEELSRRIFTEVLAPYLADTEKARILLPEGRYVRAKELAERAGLPHRRRNGFHFNVQEFMIGLAEGSASIDSMPPLPKDICQEAAGLLLQRQ